MDDAVSRALCRPVPVAESINSKSIEGSLMRMQSSLKGIVAKWYDVLITSVDSNRRLCM